MNNKTRYIVIGLLVVYGVVLAMVSFVIFSKPKSVSLPTVSQVNKTLQDNVLREVSVGVDSAGNIVLNANGQKINGFQTKMVLPYNQKYATIKAVIPDKTAKVVLNKTEVDLKNGQVIVSLILIWENGFRDASKVTLATFGIPVSGVMFDRKFTKVVPFGLNEGLFPIKFSI